MPRGVQNPMQAETTRAPAAAFTAERRCTSRHTDMKPIVAETRRRSRRTTTRQRTTPRGQEMPVMPVMMPAGMIAMGNAQAHPCYLLPRCRW